MDQTMVVVGDAEVRAGDEVVLIGRQGGDEITVTEVADLMGTIGYEVTCLIAGRVTRAAGEAQPRVRCRRAGNCSRAYSPMEWVDQPSIAPPTPPPTSGMRRMIRMAARRPPMRLSSSANTAAVTCASSVLSNAGAVARPIGVVGRAPDSTRRYATTRPSSRTSRAVRTRRSSMS